MMKRTFKKILIFQLTLILFFSVSCTDDFLSLTPISDYNAGSFYKTPRQMEMAVTGVYEAFRQVHLRSWTTYNDIRSDILDHGNYDHGESSNNTFMENTTISIWQQLYTIVYRANVVLEKIDEIEFSDENQKSLIKGQAYFFRGWAYYSLVYLFDGVPLFIKNLTPEEAPTLPRASVQDVYNQAKTDLESAINLLPETWDANSFGKVSKYAAMGVLAKLHLSQIGLPLNKDENAQWNLALPLLNNIISSGHFAFESDYTVLFSKEGETSSEIILSAVNSENGLGASNSSYAHQFMAYPIGVWPQLLLDDAYNMYDENDIRRDHSFALQFTHNDGRVIDIINNIKFAYSYNEGNAELGFDFPLLRYTDVMLLKAEGESVVAGSVQASTIEAINLVRTRAGITTVTNTDIPDIESLKSFILEERSKEFIFENVRWFDLLRTKTYVQALIAAGKQANENWRYFPIPLSEIQRHDEGLWQQNAGYEHIQ